jgi:beta propeller repeat protein
VGRDDAPHTAREAEIWTMDLAVAGSERRLTMDAFEQTQPDVSGDKIVWADFAHSPDAIYIDVADPLRNNADIYGWDLASDSLFIVTDNPSKQLRPAIDGDAVTWLDWRDINPEPKYSEFQVYAKRLGPEGIERRLAWSSWSRPELWRRPAIDGDLVVFVAEPSAPGTGFLTGLIAARIDGGAPWLVAGSTHVIDSVVVRDRTAVWVGGGLLGRSEIRAR